MNTTDVSALDASPLERIFDDVEPHTNLLELPAGEGVSEHEHPGRSIVFYVLKGEIRLRVGDETATLRAGAIAQFDGDQPIAPTAEADSRALLILSPDGD